MSNQYFLRYQFNEKYRKMSKILKLFDRCDTMALRVQSKHWSKMPEEDLQYYKDNYLDLRKEYFKIYYEEYYGKIPDGCDLDVAFREMLAEYIVHEKKVKQKLESLKDDQEAYWAYWDSDEYKNIYSSEIIEKYCYSTAFWFNLCAEVEQTYLFIYEVIPNREKSDDFGLKILDLPENLPLKNNFIKYEYNIFLDLWLYFKLNEETKKWLLRYRLDSDLFRSGLEDLTLLYKGQEKYGSVSHEGMNTIDTRHIKKKYLH